MIFEDPKNHRAYAARLGWLEPGMAPYFGSIEYMRAQDWREFVGALNRWGAPSENQVYADIDGNIGYKPVGLFPQRTNWDGLLPVPGDGRYEWDGYFDMDALPEEFNPERGFVATANAMNLPADYPIADRRIGFEWTAPWRARRLDEVLAAQPHHSFADSLALQRDYTSLLARELIRATAAAGDSPAFRCCALGTACCRPTPPPPRFIMIWYYRFLNPALATWAAPAAAVPLIQPLDSLAVLDLLRCAPGELAQLLDTTLTQAWQRTPSCLATILRNGAGVRCIKRNSNTRLLDRFGKDLAGKAAMKPATRGAATATHRTTRHSTATISPSRREHRGAWCWTSGDGIRRDDQCARPVRRPAQSVLFQPARRVGDRPELPAVVFAQRDRTARRQGDPADARVNLDAPRRT